MPIMRRPGPSRFPSFRRCGSYPASAQTLDPGCSGIEVEQARKRYERQGLLVEAQALEMAEKECLSNSGNT